MHRLREVICTFLLMLMVGFHPVSANELNFLSVAHPAPVMNYIQEEVVPAFEAKYGIKVNVDTASWNTRSEKILLSIAGGVPYDVVVTGFYSPYEEGATGILAPLNKYIDEWDKTDHFPAPLWEATRWNGNIYHVPHNIEIRGIAYNKHLFGEAGMDPESPPNSWEDIIEATRFLTRTEGDRVSVRGYKTSGIHELFWYMHQTGLEDALDVNTFTSNFNKPEALEALDALVQITEASRFQDPMVANDDFAQGRSAMYRHFPRNLFDLRLSNPDLIGDYGLFAPRQSPDTPPVAHSFINGLAILDASENKDAAWKFISMLHDDDFRFHIERLSGYISGRMDMVLPMMSVLPKVELFYDLFAHLQVTTIPPPRDVSQEPLKDLLTQVYRREIPPETMLLEAHDLWTRLLNDWRASME